MVQKKSSGTEDGEKIFLFS